MSDIVLRIVIQDDDVVCVRARWPAGRDRSLISAGERIIIQRSRDTMVLFRFWQLFSAASLD